MKLCILIVFFITLIDVAISGVIPDTSSIASSIDEFNTVLSTTSDFATQQTRSFGRFWGMLRQTLTDLDAFVGQI